MPLAGCVTCGWLGGQGRGVPLCSGCRQWHSGQENRSAPSPIAWICVACVLLFSFPVIFTSAGKNDAMAMTWCTDTCASASVLKR